jgi:apolipoprotein N-acyltransferase
MAVHRTGRIVRIIVLLGLSVGMLTLAFAPTSQFYFAWIGLGPWLIFLGEAKSQKGAFFISWIAGTAFFVANMWWMANISWPGMLALLIFCGSFWGYAALVIRGAGLLRINILAGILGIAAVWTAFEWVRGIIFTGLPWLFLGYTQTPFLLVCQIADLTGSYGITFWVVMVNALLAMAWINRERLRTVVPAAIATAVLTIAILGYGFFRIQQTPPYLTAGPKLALVQSNYPQSNSGEKGAEIDQRLQFHIDQSISALQKTQGKIDMIVWSETMMEALNVQARMEDDRFRDVYDIISALAARYHVAVLTGGDYWGNWQDEVRGTETYRVPEDRRNSAYLFDNSGHMNDGLGFRYDKIHLVPWGEFIPGKESMPWLYRLSVELGPNYYSDYIMQPGDVFTVFHLKEADHDWRFVTPICFEDIDARICCAMFRPADGGGKRADFLVNLTNDGWFKANENPQHFQAAILRSIENRAWMARSVNTGISGFIDSVGHVSDLLPVRTEGTTTGQIMIDSRLSFYTQFGDLFAFVCVGATAAMAGWAMFAKAKTKKATAIEAKVS